MLFRSAPGDRGWLHERIAQRFDIMLRDGLVDEVIALRRRYRLDAGLPSMRCVGYRQVGEMLEGHLPAAELRDRGIFATRQFAKRQLTWLKSFTELEMFDCQQPDLAETVAKAVEKFAARVLN